MSMLRKLMGLGLPAALASQLAGPGNQGLTAAGTTAADALLIGSHLNAFTTVAASTGAVLSFAFGPGDEIVVYNGGASTLTIYPAPISANNTVLATIDGTTSVTIVAGKSISLLMVSTTAWTSTKST